MKAMRVLQSAKRAKSCITCRLLAYPLLLLGSSGYAQELPVTVGQHFDFLNKQHQQPFVPTQKRRLNVEPQLRLPPPVPELKHQRLSSQLKIQVQRIELLGNTVFSDEQLAEITAPYIGKVISSFDLFNLRHALNLFYIKQGYINSGAIIPDQDVAGGTIKINIIEGKLNKIIVKGNDWLEQNYIVSRLQLGNENILNLNVLQEKIKILHQNRLINHVNAELLPGAHPGESELMVQVDESRPYALNIAFNNLRNPSVGELQGVIYGDIMNLTGYGDSLSAHFSVTDGVESGGVNYSVPISAYDTKIFAFYDRTHADVIEEPFASNTISSMISGYGIGIEQPYYFSPNNKFLASMLLERRTSQSHAFGQPYSFSPGPVEGKSKVTVMRFVGEWVNQQATYVLAIRSTFSVGIDVFNATRHKGNFPDGQFFSWLGQFQWVQRLGDTGIKVLLRSDIQLTPNALLPIEKMGVGGYFSVRGYRENQLVRDNGWVSSIEARFPIFRLPFPGIDAKSGSGSLEFAVFFDFGWSKNTEQFTLDGSLTNISSVGVGLRWNPHERVHSEIYWGYALRKVDNQGEDSLQDNGVQFVLDVKLF